MISATRLVAAACIAITIGCATSDDRFRNRLQQGCNRESTCQGLLEQATARADRCHRGPSTDCGDVDDDVGTATHLLREQQRVLELQRHDVYEEREAARRARWEAEQEKDREEASAGRDEQERYLQQYAAEHQQEKDVRAAHLAELERLAHQPEYAGPILSLLICRARAELRDLHDDEVHERELARRSGVTSLSERRDIAESMMDQEGMIRDSTKRLRELRAKQLPCNAAMKDLDDCASTSAQACEEPQHTIAEIVQASIEP